MKIELRLAVVASALVIGLAGYGCRQVDSDLEEPGIDVENTGGKPATGGRGGGGRPAVPAPAASGGSTGAGMGATDGGPKPIGDAPMAGNMTPSDGAVVIGPKDAAPADVVPVADASAPSDGGKTGPAACYPDPKVIAICHQLEAACQNCPGGAMGTVSAACFVAVEKKDDAACAKFAADKKCLPDDAKGKGNACGSLNCGVGSGPPVAAGCNKAACTKAQGEGDSSKCEPLLAACPCK